MNTSEYLAALNDKLQEWSQLLITSSISQEIDSNLELGFIKGRIIFVDGSMVDFAEQLPTIRRKYRIHHMAPDGMLIARWDSAPHYPHLALSRFISTRR